jgi:lipase chaperone LimK
LVGERDLRSIDAYVRHLIQTELSADAARAALKLWQSYLSLQQQAWRHHVSPSDSGTWAPALEERQRGRVQALGADWAAAFYGEEEAELRRQITRFASADSAVLSGEAISDKQPTVQHAQAAEREAMVKAQWADWETRLSGAQKYAERVEASANLSETQKRQQMDAYLSVGFDEGERMRVRALLRLPL